MRFLRRHFIVRASDVPQTAWVRQQTIMLDEGRHFTILSTAKHRLFFFCGGRPASSGVADNIAERVLGHAITGVAGVYNRHAYLNEKADALQRLASLVETILNPPEKTNVVDLAAHR
jgi:hypothetical protein